MSVNTQEEEALWQEFVEIGSTIQTMRGIIRTELAHLALRLAKRFRDSDVIVKNVSRVRQFRQLLPKIAEYLDADPVIMKTAVVKHLEALHFKAGLTDEEWLGVVWSPKRSGIQTGFSCVVYPDTPRETRYFVKTHQYGPASGSQKGIRCPNLKEVFVYKLLQYIGIGPEADFVFPYGSQSTLYIVTKEVKLLLLSELTTANKTALLQIDLISRILCLRDCATNASNCGQVGERPMIIDFLIETQSGGYFKQDVLEKFYEGNGEFNYLGLMRSAVLESNDFKLNVMKESMVAWNLELNIDKAIADSIHLKTIATASGVKFEDDLVKYVEGIKKTVQVLKEVV